MTVYIYSFIIAAVLTIGTGGYFYINNLQDEVIRLEKENLALNGQNSAQKQRLDQLNEQISAQSEDIRALNISAGEAEAELQRYDSIFKKHNLTRQAAAHPDWIQKIVNNGTKDVFDSIENASDNISKLDGGLQPLPETRPSNSN